MIDPRHDNEPYDPVDHSKRGYVWRIVVGPVSETKRSGKTK